MNPQVWLPLLSVVVAAGGIVVTISLFSLKHLLDEVKTLRADHVALAGELARVQQHVAEAYVRTPEIQRLERAIDALRGEMAAQMGSVRGEVSQLSKAVWEFVGSRKAT